MRRVEITELVARRRPRFNPAVRSPLSPRFHRQQSARERQAVARPAPTVTGGGQQVLQAVGAACPAGCTIGLCVSRYSRFDPRSPQQLARDSRHRKPARVARCGSAMKVSTAFPVVRRAHTAPT